MKHAIKEMNLVQTIIENGSFKIFVRALRGTGIIDTLRNPEASYTLFAPTDKAFQALSRGGQLHDLLKDHAALTQFVNYHILPYPVTLAHVDGRKIARTRAGQNLLINTIGNLRINEASVTRADIDCSNGILHEISSVLMPK